MLSALLLALQEPSPPSSWEERLAFTADAAQAVVSFRFSADGQRLAVFTHDGEKMHLYLDGEAVDQGHRSYSTLVFSADGAHVAWASGDRKGKKEKWAVYLDGKKLRSHDWAGELTMSPDGTLAYWAGKGVKIGNSGWYEGGKYTLMVAKAKAGESRQAPEAAPLLDAEGNLLAYTAFKQGYYLYRAKDEFGPYPWISGLSASGDGQHVAWTAAGLGDMGGGSLSLDPFGGGGGGPAAAFAGQAFVDGELRSAEADEACASPALNHDGERLAYITQREGKISVVYRGQCWKAQSGEASSPVISPDGEHVAVILNEGVANASAGMPMLNTRWLDGFDEASMDASGTFLLRQPEGKCFLYVDDEQRLGPFPRAIRPVWGPDSRQVAIRVQDEQGWRLVVRQTTSESFDELGPPSFCPDGSKLAFGARRGQEIWWKLMELPQE